MSEFTLKPIIVSGSDSLNKLDNFKNQKILLVCDPFLVDTKEFNKITSHLNSGNTIEIFSDVKPDPPLENITSGVKFFVNVKPTVMVAVGGGSAIDTAKAIRFFGEKITNSPIGCFVGIPTTSGTGSEVTNAAVITDDKNGVKFPIIENYLIPDISILYPELVMSAPKSVTAFSGLDVLTHDFEALVGKDNNLFTDALAEKSMSVIFDHLVEVTKDPQNIELRKIIHEASAAAGASFSYAGLGIAHAIAHQLGSIYHMPHGLACAITLPYAIEYNARADKNAQKKYADAARRCGLVSKNIADNVAIKKIIRQIHLMMTQMDCPKSLKEFGITAKDAMQEADRVVEYAKKDGNYKYNPVEPSDEDLLNIYKKIVG
ncbi:iron-containing alcohol dehydrogenase [Companilactobacillus metriopterae]|uniref:iron-containing alcohol dehydrogenase n=1 Tax=Companilactobacillus metriopterae TaxID=1909267 RepID=UPI00100BC582|nr:iron-containing alcohol dehydrogenase [Companilactobacillus metriopterae]